jgi:hypothetical protein
MAQVMTASWRAILPESATPVAISRGTPRRRGGYRRLRALEPGSWFHSVAPARYLKLYCEILSHLDPVEIYDQLLSFGDCPVMLCWEAASDCQSGKTFCHRHLVAQWLADRLSAIRNSIGSRFSETLALPRRITATHRCPHQIASDNAYSRN